MSFRKAAAAMVATAALTLGTLSVTPSLATADTARPTAEPEPVAEAQSAARWGRVLGSSVVYKRLRPTTRSEVVGWAESGSYVRIWCKVTGQNVQGNNRWYRVPLRGGGYGYMSARYVRNLDPIPFCRR